jgi:hypothetical protein
MDTIVKKISMLFTLYPTSLGSLLISLHMIIQGMVFLAKAFGAPVVEPYAALSLLMPMSLWGILFVLNGAWLLSRSLDVVAVGVSGIFSVMLNTALGLSHIAGLQFSTGAGAAFANVFIMFLILHYEPSIRWTRRKSLSP